MLQYVRDGILSCQKLLMYVIDSYLIDILEKCKDVYKRQLQYHLYALHRYCTVLLL